MDLETALALVQKQRAELLEGQLKTQMESVQNRNNDIAKLNDIVNKLKSNRPQKSGDSVTLDADLQKKLTESGVVVPSSNKWSQAEVDRELDSLRGKIDSLNSSQQMDMLRLQSLTNKRNEAFDLMTNFVKKMADQRSSIIGNMR
jgi:chaperonin cofactor prefoldin